jgi:hypothetical protein
MCGPVWQYGFRRRKLSVVQKLFPGAFMVANLNGRQAVVIAPDFGMAPYPIQNLARYLRPNACEGPTGGGRCDLTLFGYPVAPVNRSRCILFKAGLIPCVIVRLRFVCFRQRAHLEHLGMCRVPFLEGGLLGSALLLPFLRAVVGG